MDTRKLKLGDCLSMIRNGAQIKQKEGAGGIPITRIETLSNGLFNRDRMGYANIFDTSEYEDYILQENDILMSHINSRAFLGRSVQYHKIGSESIIHGMNLLRIKTNPEILDCNYAFYFFQSPYFKKCVDSIRTDAVNQSSINISNICSIDINIPSLAIQQRIASILGAFDRKIELNRQINQNLEALARQLYDYWFVQFDFPDEIGRPYRANGGKIVYNEELKREIPQEWDVKEISSLSVINGHTLSKGGELLEIAYLDTSSLTENTISEIQYLSLIDAPSRAQRKVQHKTILYSTVRPRLKHYGILCNPSNNMIASTGFATIDAIDKTMAYYIYSALVQDYITEYLGGVADTAVSSYPSISPTDIGHVKIAIPPSHIIETFDKKISSLFELKEENESENRILIKQRNELLPLLMNGQVNFDLSAD